MAQLDQELRIADVYAEALFEIAQETGRVNEIRAELDDLASVLKQEPEFEKFLTSRALEAEGRGAALEKLFRGKLSDVILNTLLVMNEHGRCGLLAALHRRFVLRQEDAANEIEVTVTSAIELNRAQKAEIAKIAEKTSGKTPLVEYVVDPDILGGLIVQIGSLRLDNSIRRHLKTAREQILERAQRGLQVSVERE